MAGLLFVGFLSPCSYVLSSLHPLYFMYPVHVLLLADFKIGLVVLILLEVRIPPGVSYPLEVQISFGVLNPLRVLIPPDDPFPLRARDDFRVFLF